VTLLHLDQVARRYGGLHALHPLTLDIEAGSRHAVIGANGAGKSTLFHLIAGTVRPTAGRVILDGHDITRLGPAGRARRGISRTWQHPAVFDRLAAVANVALALTRHTHPDARRRLPRRGQVLTHAHAALADAGLSAHADTPAGALPYGLRRRLELTIALTTRPRLLLLDEPSAGLDPAAISRLAATIRALPDTVTVLLIDHHLDLVFDVADTVTVLHHGQHIATDTPTAARAHPDVQAAYLAPATSTTSTPATTAATPRTSGATPLLRVRGLRAGYHGAPVLHDLDLDVADGAVLAVLGRNGAGKTTLLNTLAGLHPAAGSVELAGSPLPDQPHRIAGAGVAIVPQGRRLFDLTVAEHLRIAATAARRRSTPGRRWNRDDILTLLPPLQARLQHHAAYLSGGEQQMLALARALLTHPRLLLLDEPSEGLAPAIVDQLTHAIQRIATDGVTVLLAEQNLHLALDLADRIIVLDRGRTVLATSTAALTAPNLRRHLDSVLGVLPAGSST
jgi:branched-chain amino acid transport system ATP-binding protein